MKFSYKIHLTLLISILSILVLYSINLDFTHLLSDLPNISGIHPDTSKIYDPNKNYIWNVKNLFEFNALIKLIPIISILFVTFLTISIGIIIIDTLKINKDFAPKSKIFFGYFFGYLFNVASLRLITLYIPLGYSNLIYLFLCTVIVIYFHKNIINNFKLFNKISDLKFFIVLIFFIIWQIQSGRNNFISDSNHFLLSTYLLNIKDFSLYEYFLPIFGRQYDEHIFNLLFYNFIEKTEIVYIYWINLSLFKFFLFWALYYFFIQKKIPYLFSLIFAILPFIIIQNFSSPFYKELWGGQNPLLWLGHQTRLSSIFLFMIIYSNYELLNNKITKNINKFILIVLGLALSSLSIHISILSVTIFIIAKLKVLMKFNFINVLKKKENIDLYLIYLSLISLIITYSYIDHLKGFFGILIFISGIVFFIFFKEYKFNKQKNIFCNNSNSFFIFLGLAFGLLVLGNQISQFLYSNNITNNFKIIIPAYESLLSNSFQSTSKFSISNFIFYPNGCLSMAQHCKDLNNFIIHYGTLIVSILVFSLCFLNTSKIKKTINDKNIHFLSIHLILILISFFIIDFVFSLGPGFSYVMARFLDYSYYSILLILMIFSKNIKYLNLYFLILFILSIFALMYNIQFQQFLINFKFLINNL